ncbi:DgyrCDS6557 [Dimorphilus gyrociliatus]|nr:DgyrCDS6557 [Dimorphilus gyrociliatus]
MVIFKSSCAINVKYFPFDEQNCSMLFSSWTYDGFQVNLMKVGDDGDESNYIRNSEWTLVKLHAKRNVVKYSCCEEPYPDVTYKIQMRRKPLFYVFNMIMPCMLITLVALLGFYIPSDSGEKVTMGITTLLSMTVFLMLVTESMPPTSDVLPLIGMYYGITIAIVSLATAMTVLTLNIHHKGIRGREVPNIIKKIFFSVFARLLCIQLETPEKYVESDILQYPAESNVDDCSGRSSYIKLKRSNQGCSMVDNNMSMTRMSVLDFVPQRQTITRDTFDADRLPENGGVSPRFLRRLRQTPQNSSPQSLDNLERQFMRVLQKVQQTIEKNEIRLAEQDRRDIIKLEWQQVALVVDRILLYIFVFLTIGVTLCIMFQAPLSLDWL